MTPKNYIRWLRSQTGPRPLLLVYATAVIFNDAGEVLVQHRADFDWWSLPGGLLEMDESLSACAKREVREETGLHVEPVQLIGVFSHPDYTFRYPHGDIVQPWTACFRCMVVGGRLQADGDETLEAHFYPPNEAMAHMPPQHRTMLHHAVSACPKPMSEPVVTAPEGHYVALLRQHVGKACVIAPGATAVIRDKAGRVLAARRSDFGTWDMPGGWCELGETAAGTAVRETREETGLEVRPTRMVGIYSNPAWRIRYPNGDQMRPVGAMFECAIIGGELRADSAETLEVAFVDPGGQGKHKLDESPLHQVFWHDVRHPRAEPYIR